MMENLNQIKFNLPEIVKKEIDLFIDKKFIKINNILENNSTDYFKVIESIEKFSQENDEFLIIYEHEVIYDYSFLDMIHDCIFKLNKNIKIVQATASIDTPNTSHPFTHIYIWKDCIIEEYNFLIDKSIYKNDYIWIFPKDLYKKFTNGNRINKSILSSSRETKVRNLLISNINPSSISILRYLKNDDINFVNNSIKWTELTKEYQETYFSFILETNHSNDTSNHLTEKTILAFLTGTIPIVFGQRYLIRDLENLGFWIANSDFGFGDGDIYESDSEFRISRYLNCINKISELSDVEVFNYYQSNLDKIYKNWKIISTIFNYKKFLI